MRKKKNLTVAISLGILFVALTLSLLFIDVKVINETDKEIGLAFINKLSNNVSYNEFLDKISDIFMILSIGFILFLAIKGLVQLVKRKNILKVDKEILVFGGVVVLMAVLWITFDRLFIINYRPILIDGELEASYPSTHIMIVTFTMLSSIDLLIKYIQNKKIRYTSSVTVWLCIGLTIVLRFASGMHWISDCLGGFILGAILYYVYFYIKEKFVGSQVER